MLETPELAGDELPPGYLEALAAEEEARDTAFLEFPEPVCGVPILPLDLRNLIILTHAKSPFVVGGTADIEDVRMLLWLQSPLYMAGSASARTQFVNTLPAMEEGAAVAEVRVWIERIFSDAPGSKKRPKGAETAVIEEPIASFVASWTDLFASEYGWSMEYIVGTASRRGIPLPCIYQLYRMIVRRHKPEHPFSSGFINRLLGNWLRASIVTEKPKP